MKKIIISAVFAIFSLTLFSQREYLPTVEDLDLFLTTKTYVVLEDNPMSEFNFEVKDAMAKVWKLTDFEYISVEDFAEKSQNSDASFIYTSIVNFENDKTDSRYVFLHLSLGGENFTMDDLKDIVSLPLGYFGVDADRYGYKIGVLLSFMQNHVGLMKKNPEIISNNIFKHYNENIESAHNKTLYLLEDELSKDVSTTARIKAIYPYKFKLVSMDEIKEAILARDENVVFLHKVGPEGKKLKARCYKIIIGAENGDFYYFDYHMVSPKSPDGFLSSDFKKLAK
ncbi:MAG: hypothetical protein K9H49_07145 [Bacteroidales bacterium]|nr:hypothetical protein [Bacteroidales bacterium]MCF8391978.1 hypothetical protein [Bacteroidales bacterium]